MTFIKTFLVLFVVLTLELFAIENNIKTDKFNFSEAPIAELGEPLKLWATNYHLPEFLDGSGDVALRDVDGNELGPKLTLAEWCKCALEGSVRIISADGTAKTYNYSSSTELFPNDCSAFYPFNLGKSKFKLAVGRFGDGVSPYILNPYRTIAVDPLLIPLGTVLYVPEARGAKINKGNGEVLTHDGYFLAADIGGGIKLNHIDVFIGAFSEAPFFPWIKHSSNFTFDAYIVKDPAIINELTLLHRP